MKLMHFSKHLFFVSTLMISHAYAQSVDSGPIFKPQFKLDFTIGPNFDTSPGSGQENQDIFGGRPAVSPFLGIRATHLFSNKVGWYAGINLNYYKEIKPTGYKPTGLETFFDDFGNALFGPISYVKPSVNLGVLYRIESANWSIHPSLGIGHDSYLGDKSTSRSKTNQEGQKYELTYDRKSSLFTAHLGLSMNYYVSRKTYFAVNGSFHQPLQAATAQLIETTDGTEISRADFRSNNVGRGIFLGVGFGFVLGK